MKIKGFCLALLFLFLLSGCQQSSEPEGPTISESQLYATADNYFNIEQKWELEEMNQLLQDLCNLNAEKTNSLDYLLGQISVMLTRTDAYQNLCLCVPDGTVQQMMSSEQSEAYQNYTTARKEFLEAILAQQDSPELTNSASSFRSALPALLEKFDQVDLSLRQVRDLESAGKEADLALYYEGLANVSSQMHTAAALLLE